MRFAEISFVCLEIIMHKKMLVSIYFNDTTLLTIPEPMSSSWWFQVICYPLTSELPSANDTFLIR